MTIPFDDLPLHAQAERMRRLADLGYTDVWSAEADATDGFTPLALASVWAPTLRLGTAIVPAYTRGPVTLLQQVATMAAAAPGRFVFGVGTSSDVIVNRWNGLDFDEPYRRVRDTVRFLREGLTGSKTDVDATGFSSHGYRLKVPVPDPAVPIFVAALREGMLRLAGREGDGAIVNWLSPADAARVAPIVHAAAPAGAVREVAARVFVAPTTDRELVHRYGRLAIAAYLNVPVYAAFHEWMGRGEMLGPMWAAWKAGDRSAALEAIPDEVVDDLIVWGPPERCRERIGEYVAAGVTCPVIALLPFGIDVDTALDDLAPR
ncbi:MAG: LLM class F420-dependent oxidoreductase [Microthrixaceae bacterium]